MCLFGKVKIALIFVKQNKKQKHAYEIQKSWNQWIFPLREQDPSYPFCGFSLTQI